MFGAPACSRSVTLASFAASFSSVTASRYRRCPFSTHTARQCSPSSRGGYTVTPHSSSITGRAERRTDRRVSPLTRAGAFARRPVL